MKEAWPRAKCFALGLRNSASSRRRVSANFVLGYFGDRAVEIRDALREKAILVRDRSYEIPGGVRITAGTRAAGPRSACGTGENLVKDLLVFDMDGVLVDVTESYRAAIRRPSCISPAASPHAKRFRTGKIAAAGTTTGSFPTA